MKILFVSCLLIMLCGLSVVRAQDHKQIVIQTDHTELVYTVGDNGRLYQSYIGERLQAGSAAEIENPERHEAYIGGGMDDPGTPAIRMIHADGNPSLNLVYVDHSVKKGDDPDVTETIINLKDPQYPVTVSLHFKTFAKEDIIKEWSEIEHHEKKAVTLTNFASSMLHFDAPHYWLTQFHGDWAKEMRMQQSELTSGIKIIDSKLGTRANIYQTPVFFLSLGQQSTETHGHLIAGTLAWTGSFQLLFQVDHLNSLRVVSGMNPYASEYKLKPGELFKTPAFIFTYSNDGKGQASRNFHDWARKYGILDGTKPRMTLLNNWESTYFDFDENKIVSLFDDAKKLGVDLFLLDDGWFGNKYPRNNDHAGLGDWQANKKKLPHGLDYLVKQAEQKNLKFGIWLEPEMVNPKSELYHEHPDWILKLPNRKENYYRNQLVLDLTNPKVQDFVYNVVDKTLSENPGIAYIKWDCNRPMTNEYSPYLKENQGNLFIDYTRALYKVFQRVRAKYPHLPMMLCSGGGGRTDYGALKYFTSFWPSDDTDGFERVYIQWGYSYFFPSLALSAHVTSWGKESLKFRTDVAMMDKMGYDINVDKLSPKDLEFSQQSVQTFKRLSPVIWQGDLYRLISPYKENRAVLMYVNHAKDHAVLYSYNLHTRFMEIFNRVKLRGLDPNKQYKVEEINLYPGTKSHFPENGKTFSGDYLMKEGITVSPRGALTSAIFELTAQ